MRNKRLKMFGLCGVMGWSTTIIGLPELAVVFFIVGLIFAFWYVLTSGKRTRSE